VFNGITGEYQYFKLMGFNQTVATINSPATALPNGLSGVIENTENETGVLADATITINGSTDCLFNGFMRDHSSGTSGKLLLVKQGTSNLTLMGTAANNQIIYTGSTTVSGGTLTLRELTSAFVSPVTDNAAVVLDYSTNSSLGQVFSGTGTV